MAAEATRGGRGARALRWAPAIANGVDLARVRRSRFVGAMRIALPLLALVLIALLIAWPQVYRRNDGFRLAFSTIEVEDGALTMTKARYRGTDHKDQPFLVSADTATQDPSDPKRITLDRISADMTMRDGTWLALNANAGDYHQGEQVLTLQGDISVFTDRGYELHGISARVDLAAGTLASDDKVWGQGPFGLLRSNGMRVDGNGNRVRFINGVQVTLFRNRQG